MTYHYWHDKLDMREDLAPVIQQIAAYDEIRRKLEKEGGRIGDVNRMTQILDEPIDIKGRYHTAREVRLTKPARLRRALRELNNNIYFDVRQRPGTRLPVYYLCRVHEDYLHEYSLIVEDYYMSPGFKLSDARFVKFMRASHEIYFLRLSQFREQVAAPIKGTMPAADDRDAIRGIDSELCDMGRHVFQAAWHEHQRLGFLTAQHLTLPHFRQAVEVLYLSLSGDLCGLRAAADRNMLAFFKSIYPQPFIRGFLQKLNYVDGRVLSDIPLEAVKLYRRLQVAFGNFLQTVVKRGPHDHPIALWKLVYGNLDRLDIIARSLSADASLAHARATLEKEAQTITYELFGICS